MNGLQIFTPPTIAATGSANIVWPLISNFKTHPTRGKQMGPRITVFRYTYKNTIRKKEHNGDYSTRKLHFSVQVIIQQWSGYQSYISNKKS